MKKEKLDTTEAEKWMPHDICEQEGTFINYGFKHIEKQKELLKQLTSNINKLADEWKRSKDTKLLINVIAINHELEKLIDYSKPSKKVSPEEKAFVKAFVSNDKGASKEAKAFIQSFI